MDKIKYSSLRVTFTEVIADYDNVYANLVNSLETQKM